MYNHTLTLVEGGGGRGVGDAIKFRTGRLHPEVEALQGSVYRKSRYLSGMELYFKTKSYRMVV